MTYGALATDYDGTIAFEGQVDAATLDALHRARAAGLRLVMVTGRELTDLFTTFPHCAVFDRIVAENGAALYDPAHESIRALAQPAPQQLVEALTRKAVPLSVGHSIIATVEPHQHVVLDAIRDLGLEWHVIFNKGAVMALPADVTKATGLRAALTEIEVQPERTIGVGDAENDHAFLELCGLAVAVANALPDLKEGADVVTSGARGAGVVELVDRLLSGELDAIDPSRRSRAGSATVSSPRR